MVVEVWGEWLASRSVGQLVFRGVDGVLRLVEKSLLWSTQTTSSPPAPRADDTSLDNSTSFQEVSEDGEYQNGHISIDPKLVTVSRPLSWPLFLPLITFLGAVRVTVYCVSRVIRRPCDTSDMIHWLHSKRCQFRTIRCAGIKNIRRQAKEHLSETSNGTPCVKTVPSDSSPDQERKRKYCDVEQSDWTDGSDDESCAVKLEKYAKDYDSEHDPDFVPSSDAETSEDDDSASSGEEDVEQEVSGLGWKEACKVDPASLITPAETLSTNIITVESESESVSDYGSANVESPASTGSSLTSTPSSAKSKFVKFFRRSNKTQQQP